MKKTLCLILALTVVFSGFGVCFAAEIGITEWTATAQSVKLTLSEPSENLSAVIDGEAAEISYASDDKTVVRLIPKNNLTYDAIHTVKLSGDISKTLAFSLNTLFKDDFTAGADGWHGGEVKNGALTIPGNAAVYYDGVDMSEWENYAADIVIDGKTGAGRLVFGKYTDVSSVNNAQSYVVRTFGTRYVAAVLHDWSRNLEVFLQDVMSGPEGGTSKTDFGYMYTFGENPLWGSGKNAVCSFYEDACGNNLEVNGMLPVSQSFSPVRTKGGFVMRTVNDVPVILDSICLYRFTETDLSTYPVADNVTVARNDDFSYTAGYAYICGIPEGDSERRWEYKAAHDEEYTEIPGENGLTLPYSSEYSDKIIRFTVIPKSESGISGTQAAAVYVPPMAPEASGVRVSGSGIPGSEVSAEFKYFDFNGDAEGEHIYEWLYSDGAGGEYKSMGVFGKSYTLSADDIGKYIKVRVTPVSQAEPFYGIPVISENFVFAGTKLEITDVSCCGNSISVVLPAALSGITAEVNGTEAKCTVSGNTVIIESDGLNAHNAVEISAGPMCAYINLNIDTFFCDDFNDDAYPWTGGAVKNTESGTLTIPANVTGGATVQTTQADWSNYWLEYKITNPQFNYRILNVLSDGKYTVAAREYEDSTYLWYGLFPTSKQGKIFTGPVLKGDVESEYLKPGSKITPAIYSIYCGANEQAYLVNGKQYFKTAYPLAPGGFKFTTAGSTADITLDYIKAYRINYSVVENFPSINNVEISGTVAPGGVLTVSGEYSDNGIGEGTHKYAWYSCDTADGVYSVIEGANDSTLSVTEALAEKFIKASITPYSRDGVYGAVKYSDSVTKAQAPIIENLSLAETSVPGSTAAADYMYYDTNGDLEQGSEINWYISENETDSGKKIDGASGKTLNITDEMSGKYVYVTVKPKAAAEPAEGEVYTSRRSYVYYRPAIENLSLSRSASNVVTAKYDFVSPDKIPEGDTVYEWSVNGTKVKSSKASVVIDSNGDATVALKITPVLSGLALAGKTYEVTAAYKASGKPSGIGGGGGGGSVGGGKNTSVTPTLDSVMNVTIPEPEKTVFADIKAHWCAEYAQKACDKGIMTPADENTFEPDLKVTRGDFAVMLLKTIGAEEQEYKNGFADVSADDNFAGAVQALLDMGVISKDTMFNPGDFVTREQVCKMVMIALNTEIPEQYDISQLTDLNDVSDWARPYVAAAINAKIMVGTGENIFSPLENIDRAQCAALVVKILNSLL